ncbi:MAG TPA: hypothetical protein VF978_08095 [Gemmatimonadales bacterium]
MSGSRSIPRMRGWLALLCLGVQAMAHAQSGPGAALPDTAPEAILVELQVGRLASRTVPAFRVRTEVLVPVTQLLELAEIRFRLSPEGRLEARVDPGARLLVIDERRDSMEYGTHRVRIERDFRVFRDGELYVGAERMGDLLGARIVVNWNELVVTLVDPADLPIGRRARRDATRAAFLRRGDGLGPELELGVERHSWDGLVFDYSIFAPSSAPFTGASYAAALGADAFGGSLELRFTDRRLDASWSGVWRDSPWLTQLRAGDGHATGPRGRPLRGLAVSNAPFLRPPGVGEIPYGGHLGPGWSVEAYQGGDLVAYDSTDAGGGFVVQLPVRYGENPVDFVAYGPFGEMRAFNRTYRVIGELLPARRAEYGLSAGACTTPGCEATANVDLRYGVARGVTARLGVEQFWRDSLGNRLHPYGTLAATAGSAWALELEGAGRAFLRGGLRYEPSLNLRLSVDGVAYASDTVPMLFARGRRSEWSAVAFWRPLPRQGMLFVESRVERVRSAQGVSTRARLGGSFHAGGIRWFPFVRLERLAAALPTSELAGFDLFLLPRPALGPVLGTVWLRAGGETDGSGTTRASAFASRPLSPGVRMEIGTAWTSASPGPMYTFVLTTYLPALRATTAFSAPSGAPATATQFVQGSVLWDRATRGVTVAPGPSLERGGVAGYVFMDENGNGKRDPGEPGVPAVRVRVGSGSTLSDSGGRYRLWDIVPHEPVLVFVDSMSLTSPLVVPAFASASLVPAPNRFRVFDIPIVRAGVLEGRVSRAGRGVGGVTLVITDRRTGARRAVTTFSDGAFYAFGVKPGDYELAVDPRVLDLLGATAPTLRFTLAPTPEGVNRSGIEVELTARR